MLTPSTVDMVDSQNLFRATGLTVQVLAPECSSISTQLHLFPACVPSCLWFVLLTYSEALAARIASDPRVFWRLRHGWSGWERVDVVCGVWHGVPRHSGRRKTCDRSGVCPSTDPGGQMCMALRSVIRAATSPSSIGWSEDGQPWRQH
jgi:hypothetical protein